MNNNFSIEQLQEQLSMGFVFFQFTKKDGTLRNVIGTRNHKIIDLIWSNNENAGNGKGRTPSPMVLTFFDLTCMDFRSMLRTADFKVLTAFLPMENAFKVATDFARENGDVVMTAMLNHKGIELFENAGNKPMIAELDRVGAYWSQTDGDGFDCDTTETDEYDRDFSSAHIIAQQLKERAQERKTQSGWSAAPSAERNERRTQGNAVERGGTDLVAELISIRKQIAKLTDREREILELL